MSNSHIVVNPAALESILHGSQSLAQEKRQAEKIKDRWIENINRITGATQASIRVEQEGFTFYVTAEDESGDPDNPSAWFWLEYGNSDMRPQHPGKRSIRGGS
jgi:hypothetical protein